MKKGLAADFFVTAFAHSVLPASAYTQLFAFGDSLSDAGNLFQVTGSPSAPYFMGHASNGPTWVEHLSLQLNLSSLTPSLLGGNDFAFAAERRADRPTPIPIFWAERRRPIRPGCSTSTPRSRLTTTPIQTRFQATPLHARHRR